MGLLSQYLLTADFPLMNYFRPTGFIRRRRPIDHVTLSFSDVTYKQTSRLVSVSRDDGCWMLLPNTLVNNFSELCSLDKFHLITTICSQRNYPKIMCYIYLFIYLFFILFYIVSIYLFIYLFIYFLTFIGWWSQWSSLRFSKKRKF